MGRLITSHNATQEETGTGSKKKEGGLVVGTIRIDF